MIPRRLTVLLGVAALFGLSVGCSFGGDWTMCRGGAGQTGYTEEKLETPLALSWQYNASRYKGNPSSPAVYNGKVYFCSGDRLYAVDAETGELKWRYPSEEVLAGMVKTSVTVAEGLVFFGATDGNLYAIDAETGKYTWAFSTSGPIKSSPVVAEGVVYVGSDDNNLYAIDISTGESIWKSGFRTKDDVSLTPAISQNMIVFVSKDTNMYAANIATGATRWYRRLSMATASCSPVISEGILYVTVGNIVQIHTLGSGEIRGTIRLAAEAAAAPAVAGREIYVACRDKKLYAYEYSGKTVKAKWAQGVELKTACLAPPTIAGDLIIVPCAQGVVSAYSTADGLLKWRCVMTPSKAGQPMDFTDATSSPVVANGCLYVLTDDGAMRCFRPDAADDTGPEVVNVIPAVGSAMSGSPPIDIAATIFDIGSGLDESSIQLTLDGEPKEFTYDITKSQVKYQTPITQPVRPLRDGPHDIVIIARDWKGNKSEVKWSFVVDNTMRPKVIPKAATGSKAKTEPATRRPGTPPIQPGQPRQPNLPPGIQNRFPSRPGESGAPPPPPPGPGPYRRPYTAPPGPPAPAEPVPIQEDTRS